MANVSLLFTHGPQSGAFLRTGRLLAGCALLLALCALAQPASAAAGYARTRARPAAPPAHLGSTGVASSGALGVAAGSLGVQLSGRQQRSSTVLQAAEIVEVTTLPVLSLTAVALSIVAVAGTLFRGQPQSTPAPVLVAPPATPSWPDAEAATVPSGMDAVALALKADQARRKDLTPRQVLLELQRGNARFWSGTPLRPEVNAMERRALIIAQAPTVCILSCADSRVPVEIVFDQGLGSVFVVRVAGNILDPTAIGSIEFAVKYLGVKAVLVMGHEACGAVKGAMTLSPEDLAKQPEYLQKVLKSIKANLDVPRLGRIQDYRAQDREAVVTNTSAQVKTLQENPLLKQRIEDESLMVCGAFYEITSGIVDFFTLDKNGLVADV